MADEQTDQVSDELYALPLEQFVAARNALAVTLKRKGDATNARAVKALPKPGFAAWVTNQTVRGAPALVAELLQITDALAEAQRALGRSRESLERFQHATTEQRRVLAELVEAAGAILTSAGHTDNGATLEKVQNNLRWSPLSPEVRAAFEAGRLVRDVASPGFGALAGAPAPVTAPVSGESASGTTGGAAKVARPPASGDAAKPSLRLVPPTPAGRQAKGGASAPDAAAHAAQVEAQKQARAAARAEAEEQRERQRRVQALEGELRRARAETDQARREHQAHLAATRTREAKVRALEGDLAVAQSALATARAAAEGAEAALGEREKARAVLEDRLALERQGG